MTIRLPFVSTSILSDDEEEMISVSTCPETPISRSASPVRCTSTSTAEPSDSECLASSLVTAPRNHTRLLMSRVARTIRKLRGCEWRCNCVSSSSILDLFSAPSAMLTAEYCLQKSSRKDSIQPAPEPPATRSKRSASLKRCMLMPPYGPSISTETAAFGCFWA